MLLLPDQNKAAEQQKIFLLEKEIALLETELLMLENSINTFQHKIQVILSRQIRRIQELTAVYKNQKQAKKQKRLEQKKRGKNYQEPEGLQIINTSFIGKNFISSDKQQQMKRLYKEAVVKVHPDKLVNADENLNKKATDITIQLNELYKNGDFEELSRLHEHIINGNALHYKAEQPETISNLPALMLFLQHKKRKLEMLLQEIKTSGIYELWLSNRDFKVLTDELKLQFEARISVLEKRTK
ncbi:MAG: hypothetical protein EOP42_09415 [Sphingobacteriaceae bacterium]|nr:MAG: hypothetical protein EOP42_09415 [Sphingobacteriaceae bacterium]